MSNPNIPLDTRVPRLPYGFTDSFDWEVGGVKYRYTVRTSSLNYSGESLNVLGDLEISKQVYYMFWRVPYMRKVWSVQSGIWVDIFDKWRIERQMLSAAAQAGIIPTELLLDRCIAMAQRPVVHIRDDALHALGDRTLRRTVRAA